MQTLEAFQPLLEFEAARGRAQQLRLYQEILRAIATHRVADRPDRFEPRVKKRRRNHYGWLTKPRSEVKRMMAKGLTEIYVPFDTSTEASAGTCGAAILAASSLLSLGRSRSGRGCLFPVPLPLPVKRLLLRPGTGPAPRRPRRSRAGRSRRSDPARAAPVQRIGVPCLRERLRCPAFVTPAGTPTHVPTR